MYAGVQGRGAQDAWYGTSVELEEAFVFGEQVTDFQRILSSCSGPCIYSQERFKVLSEENFELPRILKNLGKFANFCNHNMPPIPKKTSLWS